MQTFLSIIIALLLGLATSYFAVKRGRDPIIWFALSLFLSFFALVILFILPDASAKPQELPPETPEVLKNEALPHVSPHEFMIKDWYYYDAQQKRQGPVRYDTLQILWNEKAINGQTYFWTEGMINWTKLEDLRELHDSFMRVS